LLTETVLATAQNSLADIITSLTNAKNGTTAKGGTSQAYTEAQVMASYSLGLSLAGLETGSVAATAGGGDGSALIWDNQALSDSISYSFTELTSPGSDWTYEGWLISDDGSTKLSTGVMTLKSDGSISHMYTSPTGENLVHRYDQVVITVEPVPDTDPTPSGIVAGSHKIPAGAIAHIRHLLTNWPGGADKGILTNLKGQLDVAILHANLAAASTTLDKVVQHLHHVINIIEGADGGNHDASFGDPGDGIGVLAHAADRKHAGFAAGAAADDAVVNSHAQLVDVYGKNASDWAT